MLKFATLGSGSGGNATLIQTEDTTVLLDCGFSCQELSNRLTKLHLSVQNIDHILVTHEHGDHINGVGVVARRSGAQVWMTPGTWRKAEKRLGKIDNVNMLDCHTPLALNDMEVAPYPVPHDAAEPCQYVLGDGNVRLGVLTDTGSITPLIEKMLGGCEGLLLEYNHDREMLLQGEYSWALKQRIDSPYGHLNNDASAGLLDRLDKRKLKHLVAAHLSEQNNHPDLVRDRIADVLNTRAEDIDLAHQEKPSDWYHL